MSSNTADDDLFDGATACCVLVSESSALQHAHYAPHLTHRGIGGLYESKNRGCRPTKHIHPTINLSPKCPSPSSSVCIHSLCLQINCKNCHESYTPLRFDPLRSSPASSTTTKTAATFDPLGKRAPKKKQPPAIPPDIFGGGQNMPPELQSLLQELAAGRWLCAVITQHHPICCSAVQGIPCHAAWCCSPCAIFHGDLSHVCVSCHSCK